MGIRFAGRALCAAIALFMSSCGGGGGSSSPPSHVLELSMSQLTFTASSTVATQPVANISGSVSGNPAAVYAFVQYTTNGIAAITTPVVNGASASAQVQAHVSTTIPPGTYIDTISVKACPDPACASQFQGSPATDVTPIYRSGLELE